MATNAIGHHRSRRAAAGPVRATVYQSSSWPLFSSSRDSQHRGRFSCAQRMLAAVPEVLIGPGISRDFQCMTIGIISAAYISAAVLFISLGGLSGGKRSCFKRAAWYGVSAWRSPLLATIFSPVSAARVHHSWSGRLRRRLLRGQPRTR